MTDGLDEKKKLLGKLLEVKKWEDLVNYSDKEIPWGRWNHQHNGFLFSLEYLSLQKAEIPKAALIRMPTGSGKTGIMALIANYYETQKHILIVAPPHFLTEQIRDALNYDFWITLNKIPNKPIKQAETFLPTDLFQVLKRQDGKPSVLICTTQTLSMLYKDAAKGKNAKYKQWAEAYNKLKDSTEIILVDEGHREPAKDWARAVRSFSRPTILFSATPYRNDLKMFRVGSGDKYRFAYKFQDAVNSNVIRDISFAENSIKYKKHPEVFAKALHRYFYGDFQSRIPNDVKKPKVIIRCNSEKTINKITKILRELEEDKFGYDQAIKRVIAVHNTFGRRDYVDGKFVHAPRDKDTRNNAVFWVHQFKLSEGLDDPDFCLLAFYEPFDNARALVQQFGRIIRNPSGDPKARAWVFADPAFNLIDQWKGYLEFESSENLIVGSEDIINAFQNSIPAWYYYAKNFRERADFENEILLRQDIRLKPTVKVYLPPDNFDKFMLQELSEQISDALEERNMTEATSFMWEERKTLNCLILHWRIEQSLFLDKTGFFETGLSPTFICYREPYIFYHGSIGLNLVDAGKEFTHIDPILLERLIPNTLSVIKQISLNNSDLGDDAIRRRSMGGRSLEKVGPMLNDHLHFISSLIAERSDKPTVYLGLAKGTISEARASMLSIHEFHKWTTALKNSLLDEQVSSNQGLFRFARPVNAPKVAKARHLLLDLMGFYREYGFDEEDEMYPETFTSTSCEVNSNGSFKCNILNWEIKGNLVYTGRRFFIESEDLDELFSPKDEDNILKGSTYLSRGKTIQIITEDGLIYSNGLFFNPKRLWGRDRVSDLDIFESSEYFNNITHGEKGIHGVYSGKTWQKGSIFNVLDQETDLYKQLKFNPDVLVCEDLGSETADFIAVDIKQNKIAQIHCKNLHGNTNLSASDLHDVIGQVQKNLGFFDMTEGINTSLAGKWGKDWKWDKKSKKGLKRIRKNVRRKTPDKIIELIRTMLRNTSIKKEVWVVLGNSFTYDEIKNAIDDDKKPKYHIIQMLYLLHTCFSSVQMIGAQLKIITRSNSS